MYRVLRAAAVVALGVSSVTGAAIAGVQRPMEVTLASYEQGERERSFYFSGNARVMSDITKRETWWPVSGTVRATSRSEALTLAREAARSQANIAGTVLDVAVHITN